MGALPGRALSRALSRAPGSSSGGAAPLLDIVGLGKRFGPLVALDGLDLQVAAGEFVALLGPSGAGKSTLLRLVAGFEAPDAGRIALAGEDMTGRPPAGRPCAMVFQSYALFPHLSVFDNVAYGLRRAGLGRAAITRRVAAALEGVGLGALGSRRPDALSGGQRQRVALVRALVRDPPLLLLDEPLGALDAGLRERTGAELRSLQRTSGAAFLMVTHDQAEALSLADRVGVLQGGRLVQIGTPQAVWARPATRFVAEFLGAANVIAGVAGADGRVACPGLAATLRCAAPVGPAGCDLLLALRPERIVAVAETPAENGLTGRIETLAFRGDAWAATVRTAGGEVLRVRLPPDTGAHVGAAVCVAWPADALVPVSP